MSTAWSCFVQPSTGGITSPGATGNADCFAWVGKHEPPAVAGVSRVGWLAASWSTEHKEDARPL